MKIKLSNIISLVAPPDSIHCELMRTFTIENPKWLDNNKMGRWQGNTRRYIRYYRHEDDTICLPRGSLGFVLWFCKQNGIPYTLKNLTHTLPDIPFSFTGRLKPYQSEAVSSVLKTNFAYLQAPTGSGKTVMALSLIAARKQPALIIVHNKELLKQWKNRITTFLGIPGSDIGVIGNGKNSIGKEITVAIINSLYPVAREICHHFGHVIVDECHRCPSRTFTEAIRAFDCRYMLGLSATPYRRDGLTKLIGWYLGKPVKVNADTLTENDIVFDIDVMRRETNFTPWSDATTEYSQMLSELTEDDERNSLIVNDVAREATKGKGVCLILTDRKLHCEILQDMLHDRKIVADVLTGNTPERERKLIVERLQNGGRRPLIATGQLIGEGFDAPNLSTLFLATPIKFKGRLIQYLGRILRPAPGKKKAQVYDYVDVNVGVLQGSARTREKVYRRL